MWHTTPDLLREIFAYLPPKDLYRVAVINKLFNKIALKLKQVLIQNIYIAHNDKYLFLPGYELLLRDAHIRQKFTNYLRNIIRHAFPNQLYRLPKILSGSIALVCEVPKPFYKSHINYVITIIVKKHNIKTNWLRDIITIRKIIYAYLYLINKFPSIINDYYIRLPDDFDFELNA